MKKFLLLSLIISAESLAAGVCIVCPPGYDCSGDRPVAKTGDARLATIGDIPAAPTLASLGGVPTTRKVNNKALSADITLSASDVGARPSTWTPTAADVGAATIPAAGDSSYSVVSRCSGSTSTISQTGTADAKYCWCAKETTSGLVRRSSWVYVIPIADVEYCASNCTSRCTNSTDWRDKAVW